MLIRLSLEIQGKGSRLAAFGDTDGIASTSFQSREKISMHPGPVILWPKFEVQKWGEDGIDKP